jgi:DNA-binding NtrC family response regulator
MTVLIACSDPTAANRWGQACIAEGLALRHADETEAALAALDEGPLGAVLLSLDDRAGPDALTVATLAAYRQPAVPVFLMVADCVRPDGSIQSILPNVRAYLPQSIRLSDLGALLAHHAAPRRVQKSVAHAPASAIH